MKPKRPAPHVPITHLVGTLLVAPFLVATLLLTLASGGLAQSAGGDAARLESRTFDIARQLRCPTCVSESVAESSSPASTEMRRIIQEQLEAGRSEQEILTFFQERYGDWILQEPPMRGLHLLVWLLPIAAAIVGLTLLVLFVRRWTRAGQEPVEVAEGDRQRVRDALVDRK